MSIERPQRRGEQIKKIVRVERNVIEVADHSLPARTLRVDQRQVPLDHGFGLALLHRQVIVQEVTKIKGLAADDHRPQRADQQRQRGKDVEKRESLHRVKKSPDG